MDTKRRDVILKKLVLILSIVLTASQALASTPSDVSISYDTDKGFLHVSAKHPTDRPDHRYINRVKIFKNDVLADTKNYFWQKSPMGLEDDIVFSADPGDKISVEVTCVEGGKATAETTVPVVAKENEQEPSK